jgi:transposase
LERLVLELEPDRLYPYEFVHYRALGARPRQESLGAYGGQELCADLLLALDLLSRTCPQNAAEATEPVHPLDELAEQFGVSQRTLLRWRRKGLAARQYLFPGGRAKMGVSQKALERFLELNRKSVERASMFSPLTAREEREVFRIARELVHAEGLSLTAAAGRIARRIGRARETVRLLLRRHDHESPDEAIFGVPRPRLSEDDLSRMYGDYRAGTSVPEIAGRLGRSPSSIYRLLNRLHAEELLLRPLATPMPDPSFEYPDAVSAILGDDLQRLLGELEDRASSGKSVGPSQLGREEEIFLFRAHHYVRFLMMRLRARLKPRRYVATRLLNRIEALYDLDSRLVRCVFAVFQPMVRRIARQHASPVLDIAELNREGEKTLEEMVDSFDFRGHARFQNYLRLELLKRFGRAIAGRSAESSSEPYEP